MKITIGHAGLLIAMLLNASGLALAQDTQGRSPADRRAALLAQAARGAEALPALSAALQDENLVVRRTAIRLLTEIGPAARPALIEALDNSDALVRRAALFALADPPDAASLPQLRQAVEDPDPFVRLVAAQLLVQIKPRTQEIVDLLDQVRQDDSGPVREVGAQALWPFFRETVSIRDRTDWDHDIIVAQTIPLPTEGWRFKTDPLGDGHLAKWHETGFDDSAWTPIEIGKDWESQGHIYDGHAWYRGSFDLPAKPEHLAAEIAFGGVDEVAWVWINGQYVGQHDLGSAGWDQAFTLDVTKELKWGETNQITVRVHDSAYAGGIWKPVSIQVLQ